MKFLRYIRSVRPAINILAVGALIVIVLMDFYLRTIPEVFRYGYEIGQIVYGIALSILSSYVFYFIVVHIKTEKDKENINAYVARTIERIIGRCSAQLMALAQAGSSSADKLWESKAEVEAVFRKLNPKGDAPMVLGWPGQRANWLQYLDDYRRDTLSKVEKIFRKMPFLDSRLVVLLAKLEDCHYFFMIASSVNIPLRNTNMEPWAGPFYEYVLICKELQLYFDSELKEYKHRT